MSRCTRPHGGYTLIEILVVIAIIGIMIARALARGQRANRQRESCLNNLKQLGLGIVLLHDTYKTLPPLCLDVSGGSLVAISTARPARVPYTALSLAIATIDENVAYNMLNPALMAAARRRRRSLATCARRIQPTPLRPLDCPRTGRPTTGPWATTRRTSTSSATRRTARPSAWHGFHNRSRTACPTRCCSANSMAPAPRPGDVNSSATYGSLWGSDPFSEASHAPGIAHQGRDDRLPGLPNVSGEPELADRVRLRLGRSRATPRA